jgi:hypothetical protein
MAETAAKPEVDDLPTGEELDIETMSEAEMDEVEAETEVPVDTEAEVPIVEDAAGQLHIGGPGTEPKFSTDAGGNPPEEVHIKIGSYKLEWGEDIERNQDFLFLAHVKIGDVVLGSDKVGQAAIMGLAEFDTTMDARAALMAVHDLKSRDQTARAVIDQAASVAQKILENGAPESGVDLAFQMREELYSRFHVEDDAHTATYGMEDEEPESPSDDPDWEAAAPEVDGASALTEVPDDELLAARERRLEEQIADAVSRGDNEAQDALREELGQVRLQANPDLVWSET